MFAMELHKCNTFTKKKKKNYLFNLLFCCSAENDRDDQPRPNVYIPPNLRKKTIVEQQTVSDVSANAVPDRAADGSEIVENIVVEAPNDVRTDPDGQSSEPDVVKDQSITEVSADIDEDKNDSGFIECGKNISDKSY